jgi:molybdate transport repressor ModE-like protein
MAGKNRTSLDWEDVRIFVALARHGSLSAAARAISVTHATISRRIESLQEALGERLIDRRQDGYVLTPAGTRALALATDMETAAATLSRGSSDDGLKGLVRVSVPPTLGQRFLAAELAKLSVKHPGLDLDVSTDLRNVSLERRETDVALRLGRLQNGDVIAKLLATLGFGFYASAKWCGRINDGVQPVFVGFDEANSYLPEAAWLARHFPRARVSFPNK